MWSVDSAPGLFQMLPEEDEDATNAALEVRFASTLLKLRSGQGLWRLGSHTNRDLDGLLSSRSEHGGEGERWHAQSGTHDARNCPRCCASALPPLIRLACSPGRFVRGHRPSS
jgi:hypothetical protein